MPTLFPGSIHYHATYGERAPRHLLKGLLAKVARSAFTVRQEASIAYLTRYVIDELADTGRLLLVDEANLLSRQSFMVIRDIHKQAKIPVVLVGTMELLQTIDDFTQYQGQFKRLFSMTLNVTEEMDETGDPLYSIEEVRQFARNNGLRLTNDGASEATETGNIAGWGGLGACKNLLINASKLTDARGARAIRASDVREALRQMEGAPGFERTKARRRDGGRKVAAA